jgi:hypothetical protein
MKYVFIAAICIPQLSFAQLTKTDSLWLPFDKFIGTWTGSGDGVDGKGTYERTYQFVFNKKYIELKNKSTYPPTTAKPKGYVHEDVGYISYDRIRKTFVFRQFHSEGFVNQYLLEKVSPDGRAFTFVSEFIENIPNGWRARETYTFAASGELTEVFELAEPGKEFELYSKATLRKK